MRILFFCSLFFLACVPSTYLDSEPEQEKGTILREIDRCTVYSWLEPDTAKVLRKVLKPGMYLKELYVSQDSFYLEYSPQFPFYDTLPREPVAVKFVDGERVEQSKPSCDEKTPDTLQINFGKNAYTSQIPWAKIPISKVDFQAAFDTLTLNQCRRGYETMLAQGFIFKAEGLPSFMSIERNYFQYCQPQTHYTGVALGEKCLPGDQVHFSCKAEPYAYQRSLRTVPQTLKGVGHGFVYGVVPDSIKNTSIEWEAITEDIYGRIDTLRITSFLKGL